MLNHVINPQKNTSARCCNAKDGSPPSIHVESSTGVCEGCLHRPSERTEPVQQRAMALTAEVLSASRRARFRMEPVVFIGQTKMYVLRINVEKPGSRNGVRINGEGKPNPQLQAPNARFAARSATRHEHLAALQSQERVADSRPCCTALQGFRNSSSLVY